MNRILLAPLLLLICLLASCTKNDIEKQPLTFEAFKTSLTPDMRYNELVDTFGEPKADIGSGIHIYVYELDDATQIRIGYTDKMEYARQVDAKGNLLRTIF